MLKDDLLKLKEDFGPNGNLCSLARAYQKMDSETQVIFLEVMASAAFTSDIARALRSDGIACSRDTLSRKRKCFKMQNPECCMIENRPK